MGGKQGATASMEPEVQAGIELTVRDYFEGWFEGDAARMERALHPELSKRSPYGSADLDSDTAGEMIEATAAGRGTRHPAERRALDIEIIDVYGPITSVVVRSAVYREYLHLVAAGEGWKIIHALWMPVED